MPRRVDLMLSSLVKEPFDDPQWIFEPKFDGLRVAALLENKRITLKSRNDLSQEKAFPDVVSELERAISGRVILDGEIVCLDERGRSSFRLLQQRFHLTNPSVIAYRAEQFPAYFYIFDILYLDKYDLRDLTVEERKKVLRRAVKWNDRIRWTDHIREKGIESFKRACKEGLEGIVAKNLGSRYVSARSKSWLKIKCSGRQEFVIGGFTEPRGSRIGLGAILVGYYSDDGKDLIYAGKVGTGFNNEMLTDLRRLRDALRQTNSPFTKGDPPRGKDVHWVKPKLVAEIAFAEWTQHGLLRQPRFEGLREDKPATAIHRERAR